MIFLVFAVFGHSLAQWSESDHRKRGPQGVSEWDRDHWYKSESGGRWPWLWWPWSDGTQSDIAIYYYYWGGINYLESHLSSKFFSVKSLTNSNFF